MNNLDVWLLSFRLREMIFDNFSKLSSLITPKASTSSMYSATIYHNFIFSTKKKERWEGLYSTYRNTNVLERRYFVMRRQLLLLCHIQLFFSWCNRLLGDLSTLTITTNIFFVLFYRTSKSTFTNDTKQDTSTTLDRLSWTRSNSVIIVTIIISFLLSFFGYSTTASGISNRLFRTWLRSNNYFYSRLSFRCIGGSRSFGSTCSSWFFTTCSSTTIWYLNALFLSWGKY